MKISLISRDGDLRLQNGDLLMAISPEGDISVPQWPNPDREVLAAALYDAREMGLIPACADQAELPNGEVFWFDRFLAFGDEEASLGAFPLLED